MTQHIIELGDILGFSGGGLIGKTIKWFEKGYSESPSVLSHAGLFVNEGSCKNVNVVEALFPKGVTYRRFYTHYADALDKCYLIKPKNLSVAERLLIVKTAMQYVNSPYGVLKLLPHAADGALAKVFRKRDFRFFRNLCFVDTYPICSYLVAKAYDVVDLNFNIKESMATPDDIWDFAVNNKDKYSIVKMSELI